MRRGVAEVTGRSEPAGLLCGAVDRMHTGSLTSSTLGWAILLVLLATGCPDGGTPDAAAGDGEVELGTGTTQFESFVMEDQELILWAGPQGGHHFILHARIRGMDPGDPTRPGIVENPSTRFSVHTENGEQVDLMLPPYRLGYRDDGDGWHTMVSGHIIQVIEDRVPELYGARVRIQVDVEDALGRTATDDAWIIAVESAIDGDAGVPRDVDAGLPDAGL